MWLLVYVCVVPAVVLDMVGVCEHGAPLSIFDVVHFLAWHIPEAHVLDLFMMHSSVRSPLLSFSSQDSSMAGGTCICCAVLTSPNALCSAHFVWIGAAGCAVNFAAIVVQTNYEHMKAQDQKHAPS